LASRGHFNGFFALHSHKTHRRLIVGGFDAFALIRPDRAIARFGRLCYSLSIPRRMMRKCHGLQAGRRVTLLVKIEKAKLDHVKPIHQLLMEFARQGSLLPRSLSDICSNLRDFYVALDDGKVVGCGALHITWTDLAEIRSLAVVAAGQRQGMGRRLVHKCLLEAKTLRIPRVFTLTFVPGFFEKLNFDRVERNALPHKIWTDCVNCPHFPDCGEVPMLIELKPKGPQ
jgi:amino-acid N-acetyltransferase